MKLFLYHLLNASSIKFCRIRIQRSEIKPPNGFKLWNKFHHLIIHRWPIIHLDSMCVYVLCKVIKVNFSSLRVLNCFWTIYWKGCFLSARPLIINKVSTLLWTYFWALCFTDLPCLSSHQYRTFLITIASYWVLIAGRANNPIFFSETYFLLFSFYIFNFERFIVIIFYYWSITYPIKHINLCLYLYDYHHMYTYS